MWNDVILFYESFHHCLDFIDLIATLKGHLAPGGKVLLAGEPIVYRDNPVVPYPWGMRLDAECAAIVRHRGWLELGFHEDFLVSQFLKAGYTWKSHPGHISHWANVHEFQLRGEQLEMEHYVLPEPIDSTWHARQPGGRFTRDLSL